MINAALLRELATAQAALLAAQLRIWRQPPGRLIACATPVVRPRTPVNLAAACQAERIARSVERVARHGLFRPRCLVRAMALHALLEKRGVKGSIIRIGVRPLADRLLAHAWVELGGAVLMDRPADVAHLATLVDAQLPDVAL